MEQAPMVCSEFVYLSYKKGGIDLKMKDGVFAAVPKHRIRKANQNIKNTLRSCTELSDADKLKIIDELRIFDEMSLMDEPGNKNDLNIVQQVRKYWEGISPGEFQAGVAKWRDEERRRAPYSGIKLDQELGLGLLSRCRDYRDEQISHELMYSVYEFSQAVYRARNKRRVEKAVEFKTALEFIENMESLFITPEDLLHNCDSIEPVGEILC